MKNFKLTSLIRKSVITLCLSLITLLSVAQNFYISPTGNDATGNGSQTSPWKTLFKATSTVTTSGNTINILPGTYVETLTSDLRPGVSIKGSGIDISIVKSSVSGDWSTFLNLESSTVTNGNQTISDVTFDGQYVSETNKKTWMGIWVTLRSNVVIFNSKIINFYDRGVIFSGHGMTNPLQDPNIYCTGNKFYNNIILNCARNTPAYGAGCFNIGGQNGMEIYNNTIIQDQRPDGLNGWPIKYWENGFNKGVKILNNTLKKKNFSSNQYNGSGDWNFAIELFNQSGLEIGGNNIQGSIDLNYNYKWSPYTYSVWIHDNVLDHNPVNQREEDGIIFEFATQDAIIENNKFLNKAVGITFNIRTPNNSGGYTYPAPVGGYSATTNVIIRNNLFANLYSSYSYGNCCGSVGIQFYTEFESKDGYVRNLQIYNNTFVNKTGNATNTGIDLTHFINGTSPRTDGITIRNNIFQGFTDMYLLGGSSKMLNTITKDNCVWNNGTNNDPVWTGTLTNTGNLKVNPGLDVNYLISPTSPLYGLGIGYQSNSTPPSACTSWIFSAWSACNANGTQTRTVISSSPVGCVGNPPSDSLVRTCTPPPVVNIPPVANAGPDQTIALPTNTVNLIGTNSSDPDGVIVSYLWTKILGPTCTITSPSSVATSVTGLVQGNYEFELTVTDDSGAIKKDTVKVNVNAAPVVVTVNAGPDQTLNITLNLSCITTGNIASYLWSRVSGPNTPTFTPNNAASTTVTNLRRGTYVFRIKVTSTTGQVVTDDKTVIIQ